MEKGGSAAADSKETIKVRGLARLSGWIFAVWGAVVAAKGLYDLRWGEPEANLYSLTPWTFVTREQWRRYAAFEAVYGAACITLAVYLVRFARLLPETVTRPRQEPELDLFP